MAQEVLQKLALVGLGKMGANMVRRLRRKGFDIVGMNRSQDIVQELVAEEGMEAAKDVKEMLDKLPSPRVVWLMLPAGEVTTSFIKELSELLEPGDIVVDGANSNYHDTQHHGQLLKAKDIGFCDAGTSGGVWGLDNGYCMMVGGEPEHFEVVAPVIKALAPSEENGWAHVGPVGAGHFTKMVHNGIEYGMMQAMAEGLELLKGKHEFNLDLAEITEIWRYGSVVRSWLLDLTAEGLSQDQELADIEPYVADSGEGRWTAIEAIDQGVPAPVITLSLHTRFASQDPVGYGNKLLSMMRNAFGGHHMMKNES